LLKILFVYELVLADDLKNFMIGCYIFKRYYLLKNFILSEDIKKFMYNYHTKNKIINDYIIIYSQKFKYMSICALLVTEYICIFSLS